MKHFSGILLTCLMLGSSLQGVRQASAAELQDAPATAKPSTLEGRILDVARHTITISDEASGLRAHSAFSLLPKGTVNSCVITRNIGSKTIRRFDFLVTYFGAVDTELGSDQIERSYDMKPGDPGGTPSPYAGATRMDCVRIAADWPATRRNEIEKVRFVLRSVEYADGSRWIPKS